MMQIYNIKRNWNILMYILLFGMNVHAQNKGLLIDAQTKTPLAQANLLWIDIGVAATSNDQGEFIIPNHLPSPAQLKISCVGYGTNIVLYRPDLQTTIELEPSHIQLHEMTVSAVTGVLQKNNISNVERRGMDELKHIQAVNIGQAMANIPGVYNSSTGNGISKPVIRGLSGMRVVTYWQGLRIENQQWGGDHGLGMGEVGLGEVEIVKGPSSLLYGADALGGVVYFLEEPYAAQDQIEGFVESVYDDNTLGSKNLAGIKVANHAWRLNVFGSYNNQADFEVPSKEFVQNSRWKEQVLKASLGYHHKKYVGNLRYQFLQQRIGIPGHTHDSIVDASTFLVFDQKRSKTIPAQTILNHYALWENHVHWSNNELKLLAGYTQNTLQEYEEKITIPGIDVTLSNASVQLQWKKTFSEATHWIVGTQNMLQRNQNSSKASTFLLPDAQTLDYGLYSLVQGHYKYLEWQTGLRVDQRSIKSYANGSFLNPLQETYQGFNYSAGVAQKIKDYTLRASVSSGFRPPHVSELLSVGVHHGSLRYEIGLPNLRSEHATQFDLSGEYNVDHLRIVINPFYQAFAHYIFINPTGGLINNYPVFEYTQANRATLMGGEFSYHYHPHFWHALHVEQNVSYTQAEDELGNSFPFIPPFRLQSSVRLSFSTGKKIEVEDISLQHQYFSAQTKTAVYETTSKAYHLWNLGMCVRWNTKNPVQLQFGIRNLTNQAYIDHLSRLKNIGLSAPGRSMYVGIKYTFAYQVKPF